MPYPKRVVFAQAFRFFALAILLPAVTGCQMMNGHAANNLGSGYYREGHYAAARQSFQQAVIDMPENPDFRYNLAAAMQKQGDLAGAEQVYRQTLHIDPSHQPSYHGLAELMIQQGRQAEAQGIMNSWVATQPYSAAPHIEMAWLQQQEGNQYAAAQSLQTALKIQPNHPTALAQLGQVYQESGQPELAVAYYQRSLEGNWRQPQVQTRMAALSPNAPARNSTQVAFGVPQSMMGFGQPSGPQFASNQPTAPQMAWLPPNNGFAGLNPQPITTAALPFGTPFQQPPMTAAAQPVPPQVQTAWLPPQVASQQFAMPGQPTPVDMQQFAAGQPTPVDYPQFSNQAPTPTFAAGPANADPAHVPQVASELPLVQPY